MSEDQATYIHRRYAITRKAKIFWQILTRFGLGFHLNKETRFLQFHLKTKFYQKIPAVRALFPPPTRHLLKKWNCEKRKILRTKIAKWKQTKINKILHTQWFLIFFLHELTFLGLEANPGQNKKRQWDN